MRIVIVKQKDLKDCGCCCLQSIIKYYHGFVPLEKIRRDTCTDSGGTTAFHLIESAKKYGFESHGKRISFKELKNQIMPLIAHVIFPDGYSHYIVIYRIKNDKITIMDPAKGKVIISLDEFKEIWSNIVIIFHPKNKILNFPKNISVFSIFFNYIYLFKNKYIIYILTNIFLMILTLIHSLFLSWGIDNLNNLNLFLNSILVFLFVIILKNVIEYVRGKIAYNLNYLIDTSLFKDFTKRLFSLPLNFWLNRTTGEVMTRISELSNIKSLLTEIFITLFLDSILTIVSLILLAFIDLKIMSIIVFVTAIYICINILNCRPVYKNIREIIEKDSLYNECLIESINSYNSIKNLNITNKIIEKNNKRVDELCESNLNFEKSDNFWRFIKNFLNDLVIFVIMAICLYNILEKIFDIPRAILFMSLSSIYFDSLKNILNIIPKYNFYKATFEKISEFYSIPLEKEKQFNKNFKMGDIEFKNISVSYDKYHKIIKNVNLKIKNKSHILLTGDSGVGKSTFLQCLLNQDFYEGDITISNINLKDYNLSTLRKNIIYVGQNEKLFSDTIYNNISCYKTVSINKFYKICNICMVDKIIKNKPFRYMSMIDNELSNLSGGERQKIILARALLSEANIYILDEALSEVDEKTEIKIINNIKEFFSNKTIIYVSHKNVSNCFKNIVNLKNKEEYE